MKKFFVSLLVAFCGAVSLLAAEVACVSRDVVFSTTPTDKFHVVVKPGWNLSMPTGDGIGVDGEKYIIISEAKGAFELHLYFCVDVEQNFTPEAMKSFMHKKLAGPWEDSMEKIEEEKFFKKNIPVEKGLFMRRFSPAGRYGFAVRLTAVKKWQDMTSEKWKYYTSGICRATEDTVLIFVLATRTADDAQYVELLDYIGSLQIPEPGEPGWKVADGAAAAEIAHAEFSRIYGDLFRQRPYTVSRKNGKWIIEGNMWWWMAGGNAHMELDGATGKILKITHYR